MDRGAHTRCDWERYHQSGEETSGLRQRSSNVENFCYFDSKVNKFCHLDSNVNNSYHFGKGIGWHPGRGSRIWLVRAFVGLL